MTGEVRILPVPGVPEIRPGDDLAPLLWQAMVTGGLELRDGDILAVTQKVVSKAEGRVVPEGRGGKAAWVAREARRIVARRGDLVIAETRHGFVCANAGVDASNVAEGFLTLLPEDPDASAERLRSVLTAATGASAGVVITDTFGRAWRHGLVDVAIGCAGLPALIDLRGTKDATGRILEVTIEALADEVAAAAGLVMGKADGIPAAIVRGLRIEDAPLPASALVRPREEDLFPRSPLEAVRAGRRALLGPARPPVPVEVPRAALEEAIGAACAGAPQDGEPPWLFVAIHPGPVRRRLLGAAMRAADGAAVGDPAPAAGESTPAAGVDDRAILRQAAVVIVPFVRAPESRGEDERGPSEREAAVAWGGAAVQSLLFALQAQGIECRWIPPRLFSPRETNEAVGAEDIWIPLGAVAAGLDPGVDDSGPAPSVPPGVGRFLHEVT